MLCQDCSKKPTCTELCPEAEKWVNKDHVSQRELTYPQVRNRNNASKNLPLDNLFYYLRGFPQSEVAEFFTEDNVSFPFLTSLQNKCLHLFYFGGCSYAEIAKRLSGNRSKTKLNQSAVNQQLRKSRMKIIQFFSKVRGGLE